LIDVDFAGTHYDTLDLSSADAVAAAASNAVQAAILAALGNTGPGPRLAALAGLVKPAGDAGWPFLVNLAQLASQPTRAIAKVHRDALQSAQHNWGFLLAEIGGLVGLNTPVAGTGTQADPWRITLGSSGPMHLDLAARNAVAVADPVQKLRIG